MRCIRTTTRSGPIWRIVADGVTKADGVTIYTAKDLKVGLFSPEQLEAQMKS